MRKLKYLLALVIALCSIVLATAGCQARSSPMGLSPTVAPDIQSAGSSVANISISGTAETRTSGTAIASTQASRVQSPSPGVAVASASTAAMSLTRPAAAISDKNAQAKRIALTFDDGYNSRNVNRLLDILEREHVHATFFPVSSWVKADPATFKRMSAQFEIGDHTISHPVLTRLSDDAVRREIQGGVESHLFRPPYGAIDSRVRAIAQSLGYRVVMWDIDSRDWTGIPPALVVANVVNKAGDGRIVLMHMGDSNTVDAVPQIIAQLRAKGYTFVTVSELSARA